MNTQEIKAWESRHRGQYKSGSLAPYKINLLEKAGFKWKNDRRWQLLKARFHKFSSIVSSYPELEKMFDGGVDYEIIREEFCKSRTHVCEMCGFTWQKNLYERTEGKEEKNNSCSRCVKKSKALLTHYPELRELILFEKSPEIDFDFLGCKEDIRIPEKFTWVSGDFNNAVYQRVEAVYNRFTVKYPCGHEKSVLPSECIRGKFDNGVFECQKTECVSLRKQKSEDESFERRIKAKKHVMKKYKLDNNSCMEICHAFMFGETFSELYK